MIYGSVCSGIEAASVACQRCHTDKPASAFHRKGNGTQAWCRECHNAYQRQTRKRRETPEKKRVANLKARYRLSPVEVDAMLNRQEGRCALCCDQLSRYVVDHCHITNQVRGILCHRCNTVIGGLDDREFRAKAMAYLERDK